MEPCFGILARLVAVAVTDADASVTMAFALTGTLITGTHLTAEFTEYDIIPFAHYGCCRGERVGASVEDCDLPITEGAPFGRRHQCGR